VRVVLVVSKRVSRETDSDRWCPLAAHLDRLPLVKLTETGKYQRNFWAVDVDLVCVPYIVRILYVSMSCDGGHTANLSCQIKA
jgi:hypothetical protein